MEKIRVGVVGLGHRGRAMFKLAGKFDYVECAAACDVLPRNWYEKQWREDSPFSETFPDSVFYENYDEMLEKAGLVLSGISPDGRLIEAVELTENPFYVGVQYHPEFKSRPNKAHPLFKGFVGAAVQKNGGKQ